MFNPVQRQALDDSGQTQTMVAMEMGEADDAYFPGLNPGQGHLPLSSFARVEKDAFPIPAQEKTYMISVCCGDLAGSSQHSELSVGHAGLWTMSLYLSRHLFGFVSCLFPGGHIAC